MMLRLVALALCLLGADAFVPPATLLRTNSADITMQFGKKAQGGKPKPLSPGSNYPTTSNIQKQKSGFGNFLQKFQKADGKSKYGVPIFLPNGNINPAYLAAERKEMAQQKMTNVKAEAAKVKKMKAAKTFELGDYIAKKVGNVGSGKEYYQSGR